MKVRIVTDSISDLPGNVVKELNITIAPMTVNFGEQVYRDGVDMTPEQFYEKLGKSSVFPHTGPGLLLVAIQGELHPRA